MRRLFNQVTQQLVPKIMPIYLLLALEVDKVTANHHICVTDKYDVLTYIFSTYYDFSKFINDEIIGKNKAFIPNGDETICPTGPLVTVGSDRFKSDGTFYGALVAASSTDSPGDFGISASVSAGFQVDPDIVKSMRDLAHQVWLEEQAQIGIIAGCLFGGVCLLMCIAACVDMIRKNRLQVQNDVLLAQLLHADLPLENGAEAELAPEDGVQQVEGQLQNLNEIEAVEPQIEAEALVDDGHIYPAPPPSPPTVPAPPDDEAILTVDTSTARTAQKQNSWCLLFNPSQLLKTAQEKWSQRFEASQPGVRV